MRNALSRIVDLRHRDLHWCMVIRWQVLVEDKRALAAMRQELAAMRQNLLQGDKSWVHGLDLAVIGRSS